MTESIPNIMLDTLNDLYESNRRETKQFYADDISIYIFFF